VSVFCFLCFFLFFAQALLKCRNERSEFYGSKEGLGEILLMQEK